MPFPATLDALFASGYTYARWEKCSACGLDVEIYTTPGKREIAMEPTHNESPVIRHYEVCQPKEAENGPERNAQDAAGRDSDAGARLFDEGTSRQVREADDPASLQHGVPVGRRDAGSPQIKPLDIRMYGVNDPNRQLLAVGWTAGVLAVQWRKGKGQHTDVPEDLYLELRRVPFAYKTYQNKVKGKFPYTKLE